VSDSRVPRLSGWVELWNERLTRFLEDRCAARWMRRIWRRKSTCACCGWSSSSSSSSLLCAIASGLAQTPQPAPTPSIVYSVHDPGSIKDYKTNPRIVREMVNRLVLAATGQSDVGKAWGSLVSPNDRVGIKSAQPAANFSRRTTTS